MWEMWCIFGDNLKVNIPSATKSRFVLGGWGGFKKEMRKREQVESKVRYGDMGGKNWELGWNCIRVEDNQHLGIGKKRKLASRCENVEKASKMQTRFRSKGNHPILQNIMMFSFNNLTKLTLGLWSQDPVFAKALASLQPSFFGFLLNSSMFCCGLRPSLAKTRLSDCFFHHQVRYYLTQLLTLWSPSWPTIKIFYKPWLIVCYSSRIFHFCAGPAPSLAS